MKYTISREHDFQRLIAEVTRLTNENGWEPIGGVATERAKHVDGNERTFYLQALVLTERDEA